MTRSNQGVAVLRLHCIISSSKPPLLFARDDTALSLWFRGIVEDGVDGEGGTTVGERG
jgi:hypothetical protein